MILATQSVSGCVQLRLRILKSPFLGVEYLGYSANGVNVARVTDF